MLTVGLTGGVAAGKSTVARLLVEWGAKHIDADEVSRRITGASGPVQDEILRRFGDALRRPDGSLDRARLAERVFADAGARRDLEAILHPRIRDAIAQELAQLASEGFVGVVVVEAALLVETGRSSAYDLLVVVEAPAAEKQRRQVEEGGRSAREAAGRIGAQGRAGEKLLAADITIWNDGDRAVLEERCRELWRYLESVSRRGGRAR